MYQCGLCGNNNYYNHNKSRNVSSGRNAAAVTSGDGGMLANTSGGTTAQGMETINHDDSGEDELHSSPNNGQTKGGLKNGIAIC